MIALPKKVWLVVILLTLAVISLWLVFLKKELRQEQTVKTSLKEIFGSAQQDDQNALQETQKFLDQQFNKLDQALRQPTSTPTVIATSSATSTGIK